MSAARMAKDQQVVEAVLRDKDLSQNGPKLRAQNHTLTGNAQPSGQGRVAKPRAQPDVHAQPDVGELRGAQLHKRGNQLYIVEIGVARRLPREKQ